MMGRFHTINILSIASSNLTWTFMAAHLPSSKDRKKPKDCKAKQDFLENKIKFNTKSVLSFFFLFYKKLFAAFEPYL